MDFLIASTFTDSLGRLTGQEQKAVKTTAFDLQLNPTSPGHRFHRLDRAKDANFWSVRVNDDIRLIVHRTSGSLLLAYAGHHDDAYAWAERRKIERHPQTGAAQLVEIRERTEHIAAPPPTAPYTAPRPLLFGAVPDAALLAYGVPPEWLDDVRHATEDTLLDLATGSAPPLPEARPPTADPFAHPDAQAERASVGNWIVARIGEGVRPEDIAILVRSPAEIERARAAAKAAGAEPSELTNTMEVAPGRVAIGTMYLAKGLEFRAVAVMACDEDVIPLPERIENVADDADLEEVYNTERHLLYVACTRARDRLLVTGVASASEFLDDITGATPAR